MKVKDSVQPSAPIVQMFTVEEKGKKAITFDLLELEEKKDVMPLGKRDREGRKFIKVFGRL